MNVISGSITSSVQLRQLAERYLQEHPRAAKMAAKDQAYLRRGWVRLTDHEKLRLAFMAAAADERGSMAFTINLSDLIERRAKGHNDAIDYFRKRFSKIFAKMGSPTIPYAMMLDVCPAGRLHLHGVIVASGVERPDVVRLLKALGGEVSGRRGSRQVDVRTLWAGDGWLRYCSKSAKALSTFFPGKKQSFANPAMKALAKSYHEATRPHHRRSISDPEVVVSEGL